MKRKTINALIGAKMKKWWDSIDDEVLRNRVREETIVTGGCIVSMFLGEKVSDFDVYLRTKDTAARLAQYYVTQFNAERKAKDEHTAERTITVIADKCPIRPDEDRVRIVVKSAGVAGEGDDDATYRYFESRPPEEAAAYVEDVMGSPGTVEDVYEEAEATALDAENQTRPYRPVFLSTNAVTLSGKVQVILRFFGDPDTIHKNYDFVHCTNYWTKKTGVVVRPEALEAILTKELRYVGSRYPVCSLIRIRKFVARGWTINAGQVVKACLQVSELDLTKIDVLEDQLTGVDVAYFQEVIDKLREKGSPEVDSAYLLEIIDRLF